MKTVTPEFRALLGEDLTSLCRLWAIEDPNGDVLRYTDHHSDITFEGDVYTNTQAFSASATQLMVNSPTNDVDIDVILADAGLSYQRVERGIFANANVELAVISYRNLDAGKVVLLSGSITTVQLANPHVVSFKIGARLDKITKAVCEVYSLYCRAGFGDARCKVDLSAHSETFAVSAVASSQSFTSPEVALRADDYYAQGTVTWLTGANKGTRIEVVRNAAGVVLTLLPCKLPVAPGDTGTITRGCFKTVAACKGYNNLPNYRAEPNVPGNEGLK